MARYQNEVTILPRINAMQASKRTTSEPRDDAGAESPAAFCNGSVGEAREIGGTTGLQVGSQRKRYSSDPPTAGRDSGESGA
jgi:hypothetical protein